MASTKYDPKLSSSSYKQQPNLRSHARYQIHVLCGLYHGEGKSFTREQQLLTTKYSVAPMSVLGNGNTVEYYSVLQQIQKALKCKPLTAFIVIRRYHTHWMCNGCVTYCLGLQYYIME